MTGQERRLQQLTAAYVAAAKAHEWAIGKAAQAAQTLSAATTAASADGADPPGGSVSVEQIRAIAARKEAVVLATRNADSAAQGLKAKKKERDAAWNALVSASSGV